MTQSGPAPPGEEQEPAERPADAASRGAGNIASALLFLRCHKTALSLKKKLQINLKPVG